MTEPHIITLEDPPSLGSKIRVYVEAQPAAELLERLLWHLLKNPNTIELEKEAAALIIKLREHESRPS